jgi:protein-S-isoprenylcysteine O-methyltransferase Ste14
VWVEQLIAESTGKQGKGLIPAPGVSGGLVPWLLVRGQSTTSQVWLQIVGWVVLGAGSAVLIDAGVGDSGHLDRLAQALDAGRARLRDVIVTHGHPDVSRGRCGDPRSSSSVRVVLHVYAAVFPAVTWSAVHWYEEPTLRRTFGADYETYVRTVPGWWPQRPRSARADQEVVR